MMTLMEQIAELRRLGYRTLPAQAKVAHDAVLLAMPERLSQTMKNWPNCSAFSAITDQRSVTTI